MAAKANSHAASGRVNSVTKYLLHRCVVCGKYTLNTEKCPYCGGQVKTPQPAKFSPDDRYAKYRYAGHEG
ncbi:MAG: RNA-protein complex protein Nop10 [Candidatus Bathyarchaeia archaeon]